MEEILISIASKLAEYLVDPALREGQYLFCIGKITTSLQTEKENLKSILEGMEKRIEEAETKVEKVDEAVMTWKNEVNEILTVVEDLQQQLQANNGCFRGWCPTWKRYRLCKQLAKKTKTMQLLNGKRNFVPFSHPLSLPEIENPSSGNFIYFKSTKEAEDKLIKAFKDDNCYIIGLYGMGGSGKTSLSTEAGNKAKKLRIFDHVIFTTISQNPQIHMIQDEIKDALGFKFDETSDSGRARRLSTRMKSGERILIILDDVWKSIDFNEIGIPVEGEHHKGCKVLLTTRLQNVCTLMDCNTKIPLHLLSDEESWSLFRKHARINGAFSSSSMNEVALGIARECKGLPIAIVAVGTSLKGKSDDDWKLALDDLTHSKPLDMEPDVRDAFSCLKLSYDYLRNEGAKLILLLCSMFPEDHDIEVEDLFRYGIGLGICGQGDSFDMARRRVNRAIQNLVESCLLTYSGEKKKKLKMHDLVRDVALWIASKAKGTILINQQKRLLDELLQDEVVKDSFVISLWDLETTNQIPCELNAPKLEILLLNLPNGPNDQVMNLSNLSFDGVKELKVLSIINPYSYRSMLLSLPQSTQWLTNLHTLRLRGMELGDISFVVVLRSLQILDLQYSELKELPNDIDKLNKLKLLDLSWCRIDESCDEVIRRCSQLEELYVLGDGARINSYETLEMNDRLLKLQSYVIHIGQVTRSCIYTVHDLPKRVLYMAEFNISNPSKITIALLQRASVVYLQNLQGRCKSFIPEMVQAEGSMKELTELYLIDCDEIECLVDKTTPHELGLCPGKINLCNLKCIEINNCANLASLFPIFVAQTLMNLEEMKLAGCSVLKHMIRNEESEINAVQEISDNSFLGRHEEHQPHYSQFQIHNLFPLLKTLQLEDLPCFLKICEENYYPSWPSTKKQQLKPRTDVLDDKRMSDDVSTLPLSIFGLQHLQRVQLVRCPQVKYVFSMDVLRKSLPCLTSLGIARCDELEEIIFENGEPQNMSDVEVCFPNLESIYVGECSKLKTLFSSTIARMLPQLKHLTIGNAAQLEEVFRHKAENNKENIVLPNLEFIILYDLPILLDICQGIKFHAPRLTNIDIWTCPKFAPVSEYLPHMAVEESHDEQVSNQQVLDLQIGSHVISTARSLHLWDLSNLIFLWKGPTLISFQNLFLLYVWQCSKLKTIFSTAVIKSLPQLETLSVHDCEELEEIVSNEEDKERQFLNPSNSHPQHVCFPKLRDLPIGKCNKLKCVFPMSMTRDVPQLESIKIWDCSKLEHVFGSVHKVHDSELVLPNLQRLSLEELPSLIDICESFQSNYHLKALEDFTLYDCPKFSPTTSLGWLSINRHQDVKDTSDNIEDDIVS